MNVSLVSVIMPTYNDGEYLKTAIECILNQTYRNIELILINDGCTDNTDTFVNTLVDARLKYFVNDKNRGYIFSLNKGIDLAKGKYIARMDADDLCPLDRLEKQISYLENNPQIDVIGGSMIAFNNDTNKERLCKFPKNHEEIKARLFFRNAISHPTIVIRTNVLAKYNIKYNPEYIAAEDYKLWADLIKVARFHNLDDVLLHYRVHSESASNSKRNVQKSTTNKVIKENLQSLDPDFTDKEINFHLKFINDRYSSTMNIVDILDWMKKLISKSKSSHIYEVYSFKKEIDQLLLDHTIHKNKYYYNEILLLLKKPTFFIKHPIHTVKFLIKMLLK